MFSRRSSADDSFRRFDPAHTWHTGLKVVQHEIYRKWEIAIEHCTTGITIRRARYNAKIANTTALREEYLKGFSSRVSAMRAARRRIDFIVDIRDPHVAWSSDPGTRSVAAGKNRNAMESDH